MQQRNESLQIKVSFVIIFLFFFKIIIFFLSIQLNQSLFHVNKIEDFNDKIFDPNKYIDSYESKFFECIDKLFERRFINGNQNKKEYEQ